MRCEGINLSFIPLFPGKYSKWTRRQDGRRKLFFMFMLPGRSRLPVSCRGNTTSRQLLTRNGNFSFEKMSKYLNNSADYGRFTCLNTPFDSPWRTLSKVYWGQLDQSWRSVGNRRKWAGYARWRNLGSCQFSWSGGSSNRPIEMIPKAKL